MTRAGFQEGEARGASPWFVNGWRCGSHIAPVFQGKFAMDTYKKSCPPGTSIAIRTPMRGRSWNFLLLSAFLFGHAGLALAAQTSLQPKKKFYYHDSAGRLTSAPVIHHYYGGVITHPLAHVDPRLDPRLQRAASFAEERANATSKGHCWHYVKHALVAAGVIKSYPATAYAAEAGDELVRKYGFTKLAIRDPYAAPVGAVLVYGDRTRGHVEIRTRDGFVSDYHSKNACYYHLRAIYGKLGS
jgi:hypothetical protein